MSPRKPQRAPRGPQKSAVMNFRIRPNTKVLLKRAAEEHEQTVSAECEYQLQRALVEMGAGPTHALLAVVGSAVDRLIREKTAPPDRWTQDPFQFDSVVEAITGALRLFRPDGPLAQGQDRSTELGQSQGQAAIFELLAEIAAVDPIASLGQKSPEHRRLAIMKQDLGKLIGRPALDRLVVLATKAAKNPNDVEENDARELWKLTGTVVQLQAVDLTTGSPKFSTPKLGQRQHRERRRKP
jgi:hypothetical protein